MKAKIKVVKEVDLHLLIVKAEPLYWEDTEVNGEYDTEEGDNIPCKVGAIWSPHIEIDTGKILNWEQGKEASINYKVCDCLAYEIQDKNGESVLSVNDSYVPKTLCPQGDGYGDYILMRIDKTGQIANWKFKVSDFEEEE